MAEQERTLMKDGLGPAAIDRLADNMARVRGTFHAEQFRRQACDGLADLELKQRIAHVANALGDALHSSYPKALAHILRAAKRWDRGDADDPLRGFAAWPLFQLIQTRGLDHFDRSMAALRELTHLFSAEFAVRPFIATEPERAFALLSEWIGDDDEHVRRLVSEGTRPRLPWAPRLSALVEDPAPILPLLDALKDDHSLYVRRSVANNLNDIAKDHPDLVIDLCERWSKDASDNRQWVIRRATRTLVKQGHPGVWSLLGYTKNPRVKVTGLSLRPKCLTLGGALDIAFTIASTAKRRQRVVVDFAVHHVKANGSLSPKVFKLRELTLAGGERVDLTKSHPIRKISTRTYYPGTHRVEVLVNGTPRAVAEFVLRC